MRTALLLFLLTISTVSYVYFVKYQPKILKKIEEVKGIAKTSDTELFYPANAERMGFNRTGESTQIVYKTTKTQDEIQSFYKILLADLNWEVESISKNQDSLIYKFKKDSKLVTIMSQKEQDHLIVSVEIGKRLNPGSY